ncbi:hypothetical protein MAR_005228 [Mya arenaria]|uniref:Integrase zinc-binding domain-containing protein n=1 Tax=Mya arenaria TaxID=6604 RepID=A0ABY7EYX9_MYAAR|nr:hypothetical protein MAR_005228 [Mya arenaria]
MGEGDQRSFITSEMACKQQFKTEGVDVIHTSTFGNPVHRQNIFKPQRFPSMLLKRKITYPVAQCRLAHTVTRLRLKNRISSIRHYVKSVLRSCVVCRRNTGKPYSAAEEPPLSPSITVRDDSSFTVSGPNSTCYDRGSDI